MPANEQHKKHYECKTSKICCIVKHNLIYSNVGVSRNFIFDINNKLWKRREWTYIAYSTIVVSKDYDRFFQYVLLK